MAPNDTKDICFFFLFFFAISVKRMIIIIIIIQFGNNSVEGDEIKRNRIVCWSLGTIGDLIAFAHLVD